MNKPEVGKLLLLASGFDRRIVDELTVSSWFSVPAIQQANYDDAAQAVIAHQTGPNKDKYLTVGLVCDYITGINRQSAEQVAVDARSARNRGLVPKDWDERQRIPAEAMEKLTQLRAEENAIATKYAAIESASDEWTHVFPGESNFGEVGRQI